MIDNRQPNLILYGGSFDPPHQGHVQAVEQTCLMFPEARFVIVPGRFPAVAGNQLKRPEISFEKRVKMCQIAFDTPLLKSKCSVSVVEATLPFPNYTLNTIKEFKRNFPTDRLALLIGSDQFKVFHRWFKPLAILQNASLIVVKREHDVQTLSEFKEIGIKVLSNLSVETSESEFYSMKLREDLNFPTIQVDFSDFNSSMYLVDVSICKASSTNIRNLLKDNGTIPGNWLSSTILNYIKDNNLYSYIESKS